MSTSDKKAPFIVRSEVGATNDQDTARRNAILSELTDEDLDRVAGGTNHPTFEATWTDSGGGDEKYVKDYS